MDFWFFTNLVSILCHFVLEFISSRSRFYLILLSASVCLDVKLLANITVAGTTPPQTRVLTTLLVILLCAVLYFCYDLCYERRVEAAIEFMYKKEVVRHALTRRQHRQQLRVIRKQAHVLRNECLRLKTLLEEANSRFRDAKKEHDEAHKLLLAQLQTAQDRVSCLEVRVNTLAKAETQAKSELKATKIRLRSFESKLVQADANLQDAEDKIRNGGTHMTDANQKLNRANEKLTRVNDELKIVKSRELCLLTANKALKRERDVVDKRSSDLESRMLEEQQEKDQLQGRLNTSQSQLKISETQLLCLNTTIDSLQKDRVTLLNRQTELEGKVFEEQQEKLDIETKLKNEIDTNAKLTEELASEKSCNIDLKVDFDKSEETLTNAESSSDRSSTIDPTIQSSPRSTIEYSDHQALETESSSFTQTQSESATEELFMGPATGAVTRSSSPSTIEHSNDEISLSEPSNFTQSRSDSDTDELFGDEMSVRIPQSLQKAKRKHRAGKKVSKRKYDPSEPDGVSGNDVQPADVSEDGLQPAVVSEDVLEAMPAVVPADVPPTDVTTVPLRYSPGQGFVPCAQPSTSDEGHNSLSNNQGIPGLASNGSPQTTPGLSPKSSKQVTTQLSSKWWAEPKLELSSMLSTPPTHATPKQKVCWYFTRKGNCRWGDWCRKHHPKPSESAA